MTYQTDEYKRATKLIWYTIIGLLIFCVIAAGHNKAAKDVAEIRLENCTKQVKILKAKPMLVKKHEEDIARAHADRNLKIAEYEARIRQLKGDIKIAEARAAKKNSEGGALIVQKNWWWKKDKYNNTIASGRFINKSLFTVIKVRLKLILKDKDKNMVHSIYKEYYDVSIAPGDAMEFWIRAEKYQKFYKFADIIIVHVVYEHRS